MQLVMKLANKQAKTFGTAAHTGSSESMDSHSNLSKQCIGYNIWIDEEAIHLKYIVLPLWPR